MTEEQIRQAANDHMLNYWEVDSIPKKVFVKAFELGAKWAAALKGQEPKYPKKLPDGSTDNGGFMAMLDAKIAAQKKEQQEPVEQEKCDLCKGTKEVFDTELQEYVPCYKCQSKWKVEQEAKEKRKRA